MTNPGKVEVDREYLFALETIADPHTSVWDTKKAERIVARHDRVAAMEEHDQ